MSGRGSDEFPELKDMQTLPLQELGVRLCFKCAPVSQAVSPALQASGSKALIALTEPGSTNLHLKQPCLGLPAHALQEGTQWMHCRCYFKGLMLLRVPPVPSLEPWTHRAAGGTALMTGSTAILEAMLPQLVSCHARGRGGRKLHRSLDLTVWLDRFDDGQHKPDVDEEVEGRDDKAVTTELLDELERFLYFANAIYEAGNDKTLMRLLKDKGES